MDVREHVVALNAKRLKINNEMQAFIEDCVKRHPAEPMSAEENEQYARYNTDIDELSAEVKKFVDTDTRERESAVAREAFERQYGSAGHERKERSEAETFRAWAQGRERRNDDTIDPGKNSWRVNIRAAQREAAAIRAGASGEELRALLWDTGTSGSLVPTTLDRTLYQYMEASIAALRMPTTKITTDSGEPMNFPRVLAHGIATQVIAQGTAIGGTDPTFSYMSLGAFKYGQLLQVASEVIQDSGIDIVSFVGANMGRALGRLVDQHLVVGTGTGQPQGMMTAGTGFSGTISTGGSLIAPTYEVLVNMVYGVVDEYRDTESAWLMHDSTAGTLRKLRDGAGGTVGAVLWRPSLTEGIQGGQPGLLIDYPVYTDAYVATAGSNARIAAFGDWAAYYTRIIGDVVLERSDDYAFNVDESTFRVKGRFDGDFIDTTATTILRQNV
jgi:HK97 family phage major capsid protein